jgi:hypothetical protein
MDPHAPGAGNAGTRFALPRTLGAAKPGVNLRASRWNEACKPSTGEEAMETWTQPITAPRQPDFGGDLSAEEEEWQTGEPQPRQERAAEFPPLPSPIEVGPTHDTGIEILTVATIVAFLLLVVVLLPLLVLTTL